MPSAKPRFARSPAVPYVCPEIVAGMVRRLYPDLTDATAEEVAERVLVRLAVVLPSFDPARSAPGTFIHNYVRWEAMRALRNLRLEEKHAPPCLSLDTPVGVSGDAASTVDTLTAPPEDADPFALLLAAERRRALRSLLAVLPERSREVLRLRYVEELPFREVAARLGMSLNWARIVHDKALAALREDAIEGGGRETLSEAA